MSTDTEPGNQKLHSKEDAVERVRYEALESLGQAIDDITESVECIQDDAECLEGLSSMDPQYVTSISQSIKHINSVLAEMKKTISVLCDPKWPVYVDDEAAWTRKIEDMLAYRAEEIMLAAKPRDKTKYKSVLTGLKNEVFCLIARSKPVDYNTQYGRAWAEL